MKDSTFEITSEVDFCQFGAVITAPVNSISADAARKIIEALKPNGRQVKYIEVKKVDS